MTQTQKAKAYDEALEKAKELMDKGYYTLMPEIFPELKESEDERMIREIKRYIKEQGDKPSGLPNGTAAVDDMLSWLEAQGEPAKLSEEEQNKFAKGVLTSCALSFIDYLDAHKYEGKMCVSNGECEDIENAFQNAMWDRLHRYYCKYIEKQGEQKPTDDVEPKDYNSIDPHFGKPINKLESKFHESAWSEEDEEMIEGLNNCLSELEEENGWRYVYVNSKNVELNKVRKWLKSLRPQNTWKPSEEQMETLEYYIHAPLATKHKEVLFGLYNDLKQL